MYKQIAFIALIITVFSKVDPSLKTMDIIDTHFADQLRGSSLGRAILRLAQLQSKSQQVDFGRLFNALDELEESLTKGQTDERTQFQTDYAQYLQDIQFYQNQVTQFKNEVAQNELDLADYQESRSTFQQNLDQKLNELSETQKLKVKVDGQMNENLRVFEASDQEYAEAVKAIDIALELIQSVRSGSLIELDQVKSTSKQLKQKISVLRHSRFLIQPLAETLIEVAQNKYFIIINNRNSFSDQELIAKIIRLLQQIRTELVQSKMSQVNSYEAERQENQKLSDQFAEKITLISETTIPNLKNDIDTKDGEISTKSKMLNESQENLNQANNGFDSTEQAWVKRSAQNKELNDEFNNELATLQQARDALERAGIKRQ